jgi:hypothetical protein
MPAPYNFAADDKLPPAIAARMQAVADKRAAAGLLSADGVAHISAECRDLRDAGYSLFSRKYNEAHARAMRK